jgi:hypothetical protein
VAARAARKTNGVPGTSWWTMWNRDQVLGGRARPAMSRPKFSMRPTNALEERDECSRACDLGESLAGHRGAGGQYRHLSFTFKILAIR